MCQEGPLISQRKTNLVLHVAVRTVDSFVLLVDIGVEQLNPQHVFCICLCCVLADILVDWAFAVLGLWEEQGRVEVGGAKVVPVYCSLIGVCCALHLLGLLGRSFRWCTVGSLRASSPSLSISSSTGTWS